MSSVLPHIPLDDAISYRRMWEVMGDVWGALGYYVFEVTYMSALATFVVLVYVARKLWSIVRGLL